MRARVVGTNDVFADVEKVVINGTTYMPEVLEFEVDDNYDYVYTSSNVVDWGKVRIQAAIAAMQALIREKYDASNGFLFSQSIAVDAVEYADALVEQLKKKV